MSMVFPGITHCEYCGERIDIDTGRRCNCLDGKRIIQENKPKLKLIDILNKIANGELKEGTKFVYRRNMYIWEDNIILNTSNSEPFDIADRSDLNMEVELIEPHQFRDDTKMIESTDNTKIEEIDIKNICDIFLDGDAYREIITIRMLLTKLNEVINKVNTQTTVLLAQDKYIKEI